ncbi:MAG: leucyl/phenylalanyl-tRNA--protein transferase [Flavobacteriales bacterium]|nr:leucyl/phenylalanyl-tRNA--protein transferase [Flavobacteriales bacterium]
MLLRAYGSGIFPMGAADGPVRWYDPPVRCILPMVPLSPPRSLKAVSRSDRFTLTHDRAFEAVMRGCADRPLTWITEELVAAYVALHRMGHAHSVEVWERGELVGGLYGVHMGAAFFGESMFHRRPEASKLAFFHLHAHLLRRDFRLHDAQIINPFTASLGAVELERDLFQRRLEEALPIERTF